MKTTRTHCLVRSFVPLFLLLLFPATKQLLGKTKEQTKPLPPEVINARSVYLDMERMEMLDIPDLVKQHMQQWGRYQIENRRDKPDLILTFDSVGKSSGMLIVRDRSYHKNFLMISVAGGTSAWRCLRLIDLFRAQIEADEASQRQAAPLTQQP